MNVKDYIDWPSSLGILRRFNSISPQEVLCYVSFNKTSDLDTDDVWRTWGNIFETFQSVYTRSISLWELPHTRKAK